MNTVAVDQEVPHWITTSRFGSSYKRKLLIIHGGVETGDFDGVLYGGDRVWYCFLFLMAPFKFLLCVSPAPMSQVKLLVTYLPKEKNEYKYLHPIDAHTRPLVSHHMLASTNKYLFSY